MHRAGELSLRCECFLETATVHGNPTACLSAMAVTTIDSEGNVITEQGTLKKSDLCRQHDLDVSISIFLQLFRLFPSYS
jgi:hypothetical protein